MTDTLPSDTAPTLVTPNRSLPSWTPIAGALILPLFFIVMFAFCYVSALHAPSPNDAPLVLVGQQAQTTATGNAIDKQSPGSLDITATTSSAAAIDKIMSRDAIGAIEIGKTVTAYVASGGGGLTVSTVEKVP